MYEYDKSLIRTNIDGMTGTGCMTPSNRWYLVHADDGGDDDHTQIVLLYCPTGPGGG